MVKRKISKYRERLVSSVVMMSPTWENLTNCMKQSMTTRTMKKTSAKDPWFDEECKNLKFEINKLLKLYRKGVIEPSVYYTTRREYQDLINRKRNAQMEEKMEEAKRDKTGKKFWNLMNKCRRKRETVDSTIEVDAWIAHFTKQLDANPTSAELITQIPKERRHTNNVPR